jgi:tyrosine-protein kinase Etk/Wzc
MQKSVFDTSNSSGQLPNPNENKIDLSEIITILTDSKWLIAGITFASLVLGILIALIAKPVYKTDAMLQVEAQSLSLTTLEPGGPVVKNEIPVTAEIELINSRLVLGRAIENLKLDIVATPRYFPIFGEAIARRYKKTDDKPPVALPWLGMKKYAWGGEVIQVDNLIVPEPYLNKPLKLIVGKQDEFSLYDDDVLLLQGQVGKLATTQNTIPEQSISIFVSQLIARPDTEFNLSRLALSDAIEGLKGSLQAGEKGKLTRIIELSLEAGSAELATKVLNEIVNIYIRQSVEQKSAEAQKKLEFLDKQLPVVKDQLDTSTNALNDYRTRKGSVDLDIETQSILDGVVKIRTEITQLQQKRDELRQKFTESHPSVVAVDKQIDRLQQQMASSSHKIEILPETQQAILKLSSDVKVNTELYNTLLNNTQTLRIAKAGTVGDVRIIDYATPPTLPVKPKKTLIVALSLALGLIFGVAASLVRKSLRHGVEDPELIEKKLNIPVYATIPHSNEQEKIAKKIKRNNSAKKKTPLILAIDHREDLAVESLRSLRTTLHFAFLEAKNNIIMITGPSPGIGKTFVSINLAVVLADAGKKVLLIDADLRKGYINKFLGIDREYGLSELITDTVSGWTPMLDMAIRRIAFAGIDFIPTGALPPNPSELLLHERFDHLLQSISKNYDHVIIDSPPILAATDATIIGRMASATLMVVKAGQHPMRELEQSVKRLSQSGVQLKGVIFNDLPESSFANDQYGYHKYVYQYTYKKDE